jgi:DNA-binding CsgD family transcriptional regulator
MHGEPARVLPVDIEGYSEQSDPIVQRRRREQVDASDARFLERIVGCLEYEKPTAVFGALARAIRTRTAADGVALFAATGRSQRVLLGTAGQYESSPVQRRLTLRVTTKVIGHVEFWGVERNYVDDLRPLLPWIATLVAGISYTAELGDGGAPRPERALIRSAASLLGLTPRQSEVFELLVRGQSNKAIATQLGCAIATAEIHVSAILSRAGVDSRSTLCARYWDGTLEPARLSDRAKR